MTNSNRYKISVQENESEWGEILKKMYRLQVVVDIKYHVHGIFSHKNPDKLADFDNLMAKYKDKEAVMWIAVCDKYKI